MAVKIRLARTGSKKKPSYDIVVSDVRAPRDSFKEKIGRYNPLFSKDHESRIVLNKERFDYWQSVGAQATKVVDRLRKNIA